MAKIINNFTPFNPNKVKICFLDDGEFLSRKSKKDNR